MGVKEDVLSFLSENFVDQHTFPTNSICEHVSNIGSDDIDGRIYVHPYFVDKMLDYIDKHDFGLNNVYLKKETVVTTLEDNLTNETILKGSLFKHFMASSETTMKYTYIVTDTSDEISDPLLPGLTSVAMTISPYSDAIELVSKHSHIMLKTPWIGNSVYAAGEMLVRKVEGNVSIFINLASGTYFKIWEDAEAEDPSIIPVKPVITELTKKIIKLAERASGISMNTGDVHVELDPIPTSKFLNFRPSNPSVILGVANAVDKETRDGDIIAELMDIFGIVDGPVQFIHKKPQYKILSRHDKDVIDVALSYSLDVVRDLIRPRVYSSKVNCEAVSGILLTSERNLRIIGGEQLLPYDMGQYIKLIKSTKMDFLHSLYVELMRYSIPFKQIRAGNGGNIGIIPDPSIQLLTTDITKNSFLDFTGMEVTRMDIAISNTPFQEFVVGRRIGEGNYGIVHEIDSYVVKKGMSVPDKPLVVKIVLATPGGTHDYTSKWVVPDFGLIHDNSVVQERSGLMNAFTVDFHNPRVFNFTISEILFTPDFDKNINNICTDVLRDIVKFSKKGIVHKDIKPDNIMKRVDGVNIVIDMGLISKSFNRLTEDGTLIYSSFNHHTVFGPEQKQPFKSPVEQKLASSLYDIYSLIVTYAEFASPTIYEKYSRGFSITRDHHIEFLHRLERDMADDTNVDHSPIMKQVTSAYINIENDLPSHSIDQQIKMVNEFMDWVEDII